MSHSLETKIQVVVLMAKFESPIMVIRQLERRETTDIPTRHTITSIYKNFLETDSVTDYVHTATTSTITEDNVQGVQQILDTEPINSVRSAVREANIFRYQAHRNVGYYWI